MYKHIVVLFLLHIGFLHSLLAQQLCNTIFTQDLYDEYLLFIDKYDGVVPDLSSPICVPIQSVIIRDDEGLVYANNLADINKVLANYNYQFKDAGLIFYFTSPIYVDNSDYFDINYLASDPVNEMLEIYNAYYNPNAINIVFMETLNGSSGSGFPSIPSQWNLGLISSYLKITAGQSKQSNPKYDQSVNNIAVHELGHFFSLQHPTTGTSNGRDCIIAELVARPNSGSEHNCKSAGDFVCDTPADPGFFYNYYCQSSSVSFSGDSTDINGDFYESYVGNIMHDFGQPRCRSFLSLGQKVKVYHGYLERTQALGFEYTAQADQVNIPTDLQLESLPDGIKISWADNADNELGYIVERSDQSSTTGFRALPNGGVAMDSTYFIDRNVLAFNTYYYRVKPSNAACDAYSNAAGIYTDLIHCNPYSGEGLCQNYRIDTLRFIELFSDSTVVITSTGSDCDANISFAEDTFCLSPDLMFDVVANILVDNANVAGSNRIKMWGDWNLDGLFSPDEEILSSNLYPKDDTLIRISNLALPQLDSNRVYKIRARSAIVVPQLPNENDFDACEYVEYSHALDFHVRIRDNNCDFPSSIKPHSDLDSPSGLNIYPNPFKDEIILSMDNENEEHYILRMYNMQGMNVYESIFWLGNLKNVKQNLSLLDDGTYFYHLSGAGVHFSGKLSKIE